MRAVIDPLATPERIAYCGDWHMNAAWATHAIRYAAKQGATVAVHLGDYGYTFNAAFLDEVEQALSDARIALLFVDGNHENFAALYEYPIAANGLRQLTGRMWHLPRGFRWSWAGRRYLALGGAHSVDRRWRRPGVSWWPQETISPTDVARAIDGGPVDVLVSHDCPYGVPIPGLDEQPRINGDRDEAALLWPPEEIDRAIAHRRVLRQVVDAVRPREIWHGHYHQHYTCAVDLGYGPVQVTGLDCDETALERNVLVVDV